LLRELFANNCEYWRKVSDVVTDYMMDKIKKILSKNKNALVVLVEDGAPAYVVLGFDEYERLSNRQEEIPFSAPKRFLTEPVNEEQIFNEVNQEIINLQAPKEDIVEDIVLEELAPKDSAFASESQEIKIEDIPLL